MSINNILHPVESSGHFVKGYVLYILDSMLAFWGITFRDKQPFTTMSSIRLWYIFKW